MAEVETTAEHRVPEPIARSDSQSLFRELVAGALEQLGTRVSPLARSYLVSLLDQQLRTPPGGSDGGDDSISGLAEAVWAARQELELSRVPRLRVLGDRALFVAGFFRGGSRPGGGGRHYAEIGRAAYHDISSCLAARLPESSWPGLFQELAERFEDFERLLAEVGAHACPDPSSDLLCIYDRYVRTGSLRDRAALARRGLVPPPRVGLVEC